ncbi:tetratricopeptide repeat protein [Pseudorhodoplanes sp.]|uniref:tetratricopeptide repeat protein n=1 Tax=Pseudorhodoplanes sp. TaxID=1934341 RepID=UPI002C20F803|nr:tetratricopeptide repeat protein [Pseudorhodoplanes sp.]HWV53269.1 tetratricopeptide repeat protein [Pseudorhodoplanes sp.]
MRKLRFRIALLAVIGAVGLVSPALAQGQRAGEEQNFAQPPEKLPKVPRGQDIEFLFGALKAAPSPEAAKAVEGRIWALWMVTPSDTASLLMDRVRKAVEVKNLDLAIQLLDSIVVLRPDYIEAWNRRATLHYMRKDYTQSIEDIRQTLAREPRHFGALAGLGMILQELGDDKRALEIFRKAVEVNPHLPRIPDLIKSLTEKVEGRDI